MGAIANAWNSNMSDGYQFGDLLSSAFGIDRKKKDYITEAANTPIGSSAMSFEQYAHKHGIDGNPYSLFNRVGNFFTGNVSSAEQGYQQYLADYEFKKNQEATAKANQETWAREDSQVQRLIEDYQKAGINPYLILNGGNLSGGVVSSQSQRADYKKKALKESEIDSKMMNTALKVLALVLLKKVVK